MSYQQVGVSLSASQKQSIRSAIANKKEVVIRLNSKELEGKDIILLTNNQINHINKAKEQGKGVALTLSKTQLRNTAKAMMVVVGGQVGGNPALLASLAGQAGDITKGVSGIVTGALSYADKAGDRTADRNKLNGWNDRVKSHNARKVTRLEDKSLAERFDYVKQNFVKERGLNMTDAQIWQYVMNGGGMSMPGGTLDINKFRPKAEKLPNTTLVSEKNITMEKLNSAKRASQIIAKATGNLGLSGHGLYLPGTMGTGLFLPGTMMKGGLIGYIQKKT